MIRTGFILTIVLMALAAPAKAQNLQSLIAECEDCHGPGGVSTQADVPSLAERKPQMLIDALEQFYYYERHCTTTTYRRGEREKVPINMCSVANTLSVQDRQAIADYFASKQ